MSLDAKAEYDRAIQDIRAWWECVKTSPPTPSDLTAYANAIRKARQEYEEVLRRG